MFEAFSKTHWRRTTLFLVICAVLAAAAGTVGISDNALGGALALLAGVALVLAFVHPWRTARRFLLLSGASVLAFVVCVLLVNVLESAGVNAGGVGDLFFYMAMFLCPAGLVLGIIGAVVTLVLSRREHHLPPRTPAT